MDWIIIGAMFVLLGLTMVFGVYLEGKREERLIKAVVDTLNATRQKDGDQ